MQFTSGPPGTMKGGDLEFQVFFYLEMTDSTIGRGSHQIELRTRSGADKFEVSETWPALYLLDIFC